MLFHVVKPTLLSVDHSWYYKNLIYDNKMKHAKKNRAWQGVKSGPLELLMPWWCHLSDSFINNLINIIDSYINFNNNYLWYSTQYLSLIFVDKFSLNKLEISISSCCESESKRAVGIRCLWWWAYPLSHAQNTA